MKRIFTLAVLAATLVLTGIWYTDTTESQQETTVDVSENGEVIKESSFTEKALDPYRTDSLVGITFEVPADWVQKTKSENKSADVYYYPEPVGNTYAHYVDVFYVSLEDLNRENVSEVMLEYYNSGKMSDDEEVSESNVEEVAGEKAIRFSVHYPEKQKTEHQCLIPVHDEGLLVVTYAVKDDFENIYMDVYERLLQSINIPDGKTIYEEYVAVKQEDSEE